MVVPHYRCNLSSGSPIITISIIAIVRHIYSFHAWLKVFINGIAVGGGDNGGGGGDGGGGDNGGGGVTSSSIVLLLPIKVY